MLDYDAEAATYDETRGGTARAEAAAEAVASLLAPGRVLDVAGGTGLVALGLARRGVDVLVLDRSAGMLALAADRLPGRVLQGDALRLPIGDGVLGGVLLMWLLHLLDDADPVLAEAARVLRPGGVLVTSVDKAAAHGWRDADPTDAERTVVAQAARHGLVVADHGSYTGHGLGRDGGPDPVFRLLVLHRG